MFSLSKDFGANLPCHDDFRLINCSACECSAHSARGRSGCSSLMSGASSPCTRTSSRTRRPSSRPCARARCGRARSTISASRTARPATSATRAAPSPSSGSRSGPGRGRPPCARSDASSGLIARACARSPAAAAPPRAQLSGCLMNRYDADAPIPWHSDEVERTGRRVSCAPCRRRPAPLPRACQAQGARRRAGPARPSRHCSAVRLGSADGGRRAGTVRAARAARRRRGAGRISRPTHRPRFEEERAHTQAPIPA